MLFPGFSPATAEMAVRLVYIVFPALLFLGIAGILTAMLNGFHKFWIAALAPALSSIAVIAAVFLARGDQAIYVIGTATALGFLLQALLLALATASLGIRYRPVLDIHHPAIKKLLRLGVPLFLYLTVANASLLLERNLASQLSAGAVSTLSYALRLFTVPSNFLAAPLAVVAYPGFAREATRNQRGELGSQVSKMFRLVTFLFLPVTLWTLLNASPLTRLLYEHGRFVSADSFITARVLAVYGIAILPNAVAIVLLRCFFAIEDTITPLLAELIALGTFVATAGVLARHFGIAGLAGARTISFYIVTAILIYVLSRRKALLKLDLIRSGFLVRTAAASFVMGTVSWASLRLLQSAFDSGNTLLRLGIVLVLLALSGAAFLGIALLLKIGEAKQIVNTVRGWFGGTPASSVSTEI
jgi:putative peptidoglycan lipid II flippase